MLHEDIVREVLRRFNEEKHSCRRIARDLKLDRSTVTKIAKNKRPDYANRRVYLKRRAPREVTPYRCPRCRAMMHIRPCQICRAERARKRSRARHRLLQMADTPTGVCSAITLREPELSRYQELVQARTEYCRNWSLIQRHLFDEVVGFLALNWYLICRNYETIWCEVLMLSKRSTRMNVSSREVGGNLLAIIRLVWSYLDNMSRVAEPIESVEGLRQRLKLTLEFLDTAVVLTETTVDDRVVTVIGNLLGNVALQDLLLPVIADLLARLKREHAKSLLAFEPLTFDAKTVDAIQAQSLDPEMVMRIVRLVVELLNLFRGRGNG